MPVNINPAYRVHDLLTAAWAQQDNIKTVEAWARALGVPGPDTHLRTMDVARSVELLYREAEAARATMAASTMSPEKYVPTFDAIARLLDIGLFNQHWAQTKLPLAGGHLPLLGVFSELVPNEEALVDPGEISAIEKELSDLAWSVGSAGLSPEVEAFLQRQIGITQEALRDYRIIGLRAFRNGFRRAEEVPVDREVADEVVKTEQFRGLAAAWKHVKDAVSAVDTTQKAITWGMWVTEKLGANADRVPAMVEHVDKLLGAS